MDIKDRGAKKWVSLMLPEHVQALRDWEHRVKNEEEKPTLGEDQLREMDYVLQQALRYRRMVRVRYYNNKYKQTETMEGIVSLIYYQRDRIEVTSEDTIRIIKLDDILEISFV